MSDSIDTNELDNYGVWVKKPPKDIQSETENLNVEDTSFDLDAELGDFDLIDTPEEQKTEEFSDFDISLDTSTDLPLEDSFAEPEVEDTLVQEQKIEQEVPPQDDNISNISIEDNSTDDFNIENDTSDITLDDLNINFDVSEEAVSAPEDSIPETVEETSIEDTFSNDTFGEDSSLDISIEEPVATDVFNTEETSDFTEEPVVVEAPESEILEPEASITEEDSDFNLDDMADGEIDLDNFLSDDSTPSESNSEETVDLSSFGLDDSTTDSVDLDSFLDGGDFGSPSKPKQEEIIEEEPLDINLSFDETANSFSVEEDQETVTASQDTSRTTGNDIDTESIDLSEFGVDNEDAETPVTGPEDSINETQAEVIDYDMKVSVDTDEETQVSMKDVISGNLENTQTENAETEETEQEVEETTQAQQIEDSPIHSEISDKSQEIIQQLVGELTSLKTELSNLKTELSDLKSHNSEINIQNTEEDTGFFSGDEEDETIALSGDELDNILNNADFVEDASVEDASVESSSEEIESDDFSTEELATEELATEELATEELATEDEISEDTITAEPLIEEEIIEEPIEESSDNIVLDDLDAIETFEEEPTTESESENITVSNGLFSSTIDESTIEETPFDESTFDDNAIFEDVSDDNSLENSTETIEEEISTEEPSISEDLPEEIEIPKVEDFGDDDVLINEPTVQTTDNLTIDEEISISPIDAIFDEDTSLDTNLTSEKLTYIAEDETNPVAPEAELNADDQLESLDLPSPTLDEEVQIEEPIIDTPVVENFEEPIIEETSVEEPILEDISNEETTTDTSFESSTEEDITSAEPTIFAQEEETSTASVDTTSVATNVAEVSNDDIPGDLKQEIKSVLSYMDQLLENLPEEKISEFAQSEQFVTYKKLFQELGLA